MGRRATDPKTVVIVTIVGIVVVAVGGTSVVIVVPRAATQHPSVA